MTLEKERLQKLAGLLEEQASPTKHMTSERRIGFLITKKRDQGFLEAQDIKNLWQWIKIGKIDYKDFSRLMSYLESDLSR